MADVKSVFILYFLFLFSGSDHFQLCLGAACALLCVCTQRVADENDGFWFFWWVAWSDSPIRRSLWHFRAFKRRKKSETFCLRWNQRLLFRIRVLIFFRKCNYDALSVDYETRFRVFFALSVLTCQRFCRDCICFLYIFCCLLAHTNANREVAAQKGNEAPPPIKRSQKYDWIWGTRRAREVNKEANDDAIWKVYENLFFASNAMHYCVHGDCCTECIPILIKFLSVIYCGAHLKYVNFLCCLSRASPSQWVKQH